MVMQFDHLVKVPDLDLPDLPAIVSQCRFREGDQVFEGDALFEILAGPLLLQIESPASGVLMENRVALNANVTSGDVLAIVRSKR